jgi:outer membrane receptor protein involved in Fe transport
MDPHALTFDSAYIKAQHVIDSAGKYEAYLGSDTTTLLKYRFRHLAKADVEVTYKKISLGASLRYNSYMENIDNLFVHPFFGNQIAPGVAHYRRYHQHGDAVYDARLAYEFNSNLRLSFIVKNVFNYIYMERPTDMQPPRTMTVQLTAAF